MSIDAPRVDRAASTRGGSLCRTVPTSTRRPRPVRADRTSAAFLFLVASLMGKLEVIEHDGNGNLTFDERPFIVMVDQAFVDLGSVP